ncbi:MAG: hypothetical protein GX807_02615 [Erysipelotrichia bacterium]|jgi:uncharacterized metal-binding protein YceD (DUF177 family)|nr:hypothetical protein [Bacilli bacterium]NLB49688.1 hypothetical protein [Erysipelotrichia bacterium]
MKINRKSLVPKKSYSESGMIIFDSKLFAKRIDLKRIDECEVNITYENFEDILRVRVKVVANLTLICSYSLEDVAFRLSVKDELSFTDRKELVNENIFYEPHQIIDLNPYIFGLILASIPIKIVKEGMELPRDGNGYRVLSEDKLQKERLSHKDSPFDILKDLDLDD